MDSPLKKSLLTSAFFAVLDWLNTDLDKGSMVNSYLLHIGPREPLVPPTGEPIQNRKNQPFDKPLNTCEGT